MKILQYLRQVLLDERGIFGLFESDNSSPFVLPDKELRGKIDARQKFGESEVTGPSKGGQLSLDELDRQKQLALQQGAQAGQAGLSTGLSNLQLFGGAGGGSGERLTRQAGQRQDVGNQQLQSSFQGQRAGMFAGDLQNEQQRRDIALGQSLGAEQNLLGSRISAELGNRGMEAQRKAARGNTLGTIGAIAGTAFGGPLGGAVGGLFGRSLG